MVDAQNYIPGIKTVVQELKDRVAACTWQEAGPNFFYACSDEQLFPLATNIQYLQLQTTLLNRPSILDALITLTRQLQVCVGPTSAMNLGTPVKIKAKEKPTEMVLIEHYSEEAEEEQPKPKSKSKKTKKKASTHD